jgi:hypothetical protein
MEVGTTNNNDSMQQNAEVGSCRLFFVIYKEPTIQMAIFLV